MAYTKVWKLSEDGTFSDMEIDINRYLEVEARLHAHMMPRWLTDDPMVEDFSIWANSVPRHERHKFLDKFEWLDENPIIEILEREGAIEKDSYKRPIGGYGRERTHGSAISENADCHRNRRKNGESSWNFPEHDSCCDISWYAQKFPTRSKT